MSLARELAEKLIQEGRLPQMSDKLMRAMIDHR